VADLYAGIYKVTLDALPALTGVQVAAGPAFRLDVLPDLDVPDGTGGRRSTDVAAVTAGSTLRLLDVNTGATLGTSPVAGSAFDVVADAARRLLFVGSGKGVEAFDFANLTKTVGPGASALVKIGLSPISPTLGFLAAATGQIFAPALGSGLAVVPYEQEPILEVVLAGDNLAPDRSGNPLPAIFLINHQDPLNPRMPAIRLKARLAKGKEHMRPFVKQVRWEVTLDYPINVTAAPRRNRFVDKQVFDTSNRVRGCDGLRLGQRLEEFQKLCGWTEGLLEYKLDEEFTIPWPSDFIGGGLLQIRARPFNGEAHVSPPTDANLDAGRNGRFSVTTSGAVAFSEAAAPGSQWPRIEGWLLYPPTRANVSNAVAQEGYVVQQKDTGFCTVVVEYLRNPTERIDKATEIFQQVGHLGQQSGNLNEPPFPETRLFFQVLAHKEFKGTTPYAHFRKLLRGPMVEATGQPGQAAYPSLSEINGNPRRGQPRFITDGGFGIMQLTNPIPTYAEVWHWRKNIDRQIDELRDKLRATINYFSGVGDRNAARRAQKQARFDQSQIGTLQYRMEMYARHNGIGWDPVPDRVPPVPREPGGLYPFNYFYWEEGEGDWVPRVTKQEAVARTDGGIRYAYDALDLEFQLFGTTPDSVCGGL
jgi:hypothetical protein